MFWVAVATLVINLFFVLFTAPTPIGAAGIYSHKNSLGGAAAFCTMFLLYGLAQPGKVYKTVVLLMLPVALFILFRSQAKTSLALTLIVPFIAGGFTLARYYFRLPMPLLFGLLAIVVPFVLFSGIIDFSVTEISVLISGDPTFTGRTDLWNFALEKIAERPWFGYGFHSFWQIGDISPAWAGPRGFLQRTPHAHEGYLDLLLQGGIVGFSLFVGIVLTVAGWISRATDEMPWGGFMFASVFIFEALINLLESNWLDPLDAGTTILLTFIATAMVKRPIRPPYMIVREARQ
jgi:exopolysaccharide production protein ExoQ